MYARRTVTASTSEEDHGGTMPFPLPDASAAPSPCDCAAADENPVAGCPFILQMLAPLRLCATMSSPTKTIWQAALRGAGRRRRFVSVRLRGIVSCLPWRGLLAGTEVREGRDLLLRRLGDSLKAVPSFPPLAVLR